MSGSSLGRPLGAPAGVHTGRFGPVRGLSGAFTSEANWFTVTTGMFLGASGLERLGL